MRYIKVFEEFGNEYEYNFSQENIKVFEGFKDNLYEPISQDDYTQFSNRRRVMDIHPDVDKILKMIRSVFGEAKDLDINGWVYKKYEVYDDSLAYFQITTKLGDDMLPAGFNITKYDDNWFLVSFFPSRVDNIDVDPPTITNYKIDTIYGVKELLVHLKSELA